MKIWSSDIHQVAGHGSQPIFMTTIGGQTRHVLPPEIKGMELMNIDSL